MIDCCKSCVVLHLSIYVLLLACLLSQCSLVKSNVDKHTFYDGEMILYNPNVDHHFNFSMNLFHTKSPPKVYYSIFAGRRQFMKIHFHYTEILLKRNLVEEVHVWDFCTDNFQDRAYLIQTLESLNNPKYLYMKPPVNDTQRFGSQRGKGYLWESFYNHYATHTRYHDHDVFIKADDDIVFLDVHKFPSFVSGIKSLNLHFPNIINNDIGLFIQGSRNAHANAVKYYTEYRDEHGVDFVHKIHQYILPDDPDGSKIFQLPYPFICPFTSYKCTPENSDWHEGSFIRGDFAVDIHEAFLSDPTAFTKACADSSHSRYVKLRRRISINMFGGVFGVIREMFNFFLNHACCDDEGYVGKWPGLTHLDHMIDSHFTISHFAFHPQYKNFRENLQGVYDKYLQLAEQLYETEFPGHSFNITSAKPPQKRHPVRSFIFLEE